MIDKEIVLEIRNKLVTPSIALEKLSKCEQIPDNFINLSYREIRKAIELLERYDV